MNKLILKNIKIFTNEKRFMDGSILIEDGLITEIVTEEDCYAEEYKIIDGEGCYAIPGLIDLHFHGCKGDDFCDNSIECIRRIAEYEASIGVTAIAPATMTLPSDDLISILSTAARYSKMDSDPGRADLLAINMEGPFISRAKKGAQDARNIIRCDVDLCKKFLDASEGLVKFIGLAPEENEDFCSFIHDMKGKVNISLAHTNADYDTAMKAFSAGANHAVHLYNAMPKYHNREPGVVGAVFDSPNVMAELICDGIHNHPSVVRSTFKLLGDDRIILISDSIRATGMPDGTYTLGGLDVYVRGNLATLVSDGSIAGSTSNLMDCLRTVVLEMGIPLESAIVCATINPARALGVEDKYGSIDPGKHANIVLLNPDLSLKFVMKDGIILKR